MIETYLGFMIGLIMILLLVEVTDDDDDQDGGMMVPAYQRPQQGVSFLLSFIDRLVSKYR